MTHFSAAKRRPLTNSFATPVSFTVETTVLPSFAPRAAARFVTQGRDCQALGVPNFSCEAAFLLDAMAALPRKWVSGGAPTLPWIRGSAIRNLGGFIVLA
jgi:hypothetical protein